MSGVLLISPKVALAATFKYNFYVPSTLEEAGDLLTTTSPYWWVNSGGQLLMKEGRGWTMQGDAPSTSRWRTLYAASNPVDTDNGLHPQNIFRLVETGMWGDLTQQAYFKIIKMNLSDSPNRNQSNGLLLFNRYADGFNLYYTGVRVDGTAVIKKKKAGTYYTMAQKQIFPGTYDHDTKPNLLPVNSWIGLKSVVTNGPGGSVHIDLYMDRNWTGKWTPILSADDDGSKYGGSALTEPGHGGIRTDFADVEIDQYQISS